MYMARDSVAARRAQSVSAASRTAPEHFPACAHAKQLRASTNQRPETGDVILTCELVGRALGR